MERHSAPARKLGGIALRCLLPTIVMVWLGACGGSAARGDTTAISDQELPARMLPAASGTVFGLAWLRDGALIFVRDPNVVGSGTTSPFEAWQLDFSSTSVTKLDFVKSDSGCT